MPPQAQSDTTISSTVEWLTSHAGLTTGAAKKVAELSTDHSKTRSVMRYLARRGANAATRRRFLHHLRSL